MLTVPVYRVLLNSGKENSPCCCPTELIVEWGSRNIIAQIYSYK